MLHILLGDVFRGIRSKCDLRGNPIKGRQRHGTNSSSVSATSGMTGMKPKARFSLKSTQCNNSAVPSYTLQRIKSYCDYIQLFCSLKDGNFELREIEIIIHNPVFFDEKLMQNVTPLVASFSTILRITQTDPQDWFNFIVREKVKNGESPEISLSEFETELLDLCSEVGYSVFSEKSLQQLFEFIKGNRSDNCFGLWDLAVAFAKFRLPAAKARLVNIVASQFRNFGMFLKEAGLSLKDIGGIGMRNVQVGLISQEELNSVFNNLLLRKEAYGDHDMSLTSSCASPTAGHSLPSFLKVNTTPLLTEDNDSVLLENLPPLNLPTEKVQDSAQEKDVFLAPLSKAVEQKQACSISQETIQSAINLMIMAPEYNSRDQSDDVVGSHKPQKRKSFFEAVTESVLRSIGGMGTSEIYTIPQEKTQKQKRNSFFSFKQNNLIVPVAEDDDQLDSSSNPSNSTSFALTTSTNSRSSVRSSFLDAIQLRTQLINFLHPDEQEQFKSISNGVITIKHGANPACALQGGLFSREHEPVPQPTITDVEMSHKRRRYSSLIATAEDWDLDVLTDPEMLEKLWISIHRQSHQRPSPFHNNHCAFRLKLASNL